MKFEVLVDRKENPRKCTIAPLKGRADFNLRYFGGTRPIAPLESDILLHMDGDDLWNIASEHKINSIAAIDCTWKRVAPTAKKISKPWPRLARIPDSFVTAYPRKNKEGKDPETGLATIEALFIAAAFFGSWDESLFDAYHFGKDFLKLNEANWKQYKLGSYAMEPQ